MPASGTDSEQLRLYGPPTFVRGPPPSVQAAALGKIHTLGANNRAVHADWRASSSTLSSVGRDRQLLAKAALQERVDFSDKAQ
jgi:hypothetical protein